MTALFAYQSSRAVNRALKTYLAVLGGLWSIALLFVAVRGMIFHQGYPFNTFLLVPSYRFTDFTVYDPRFAVWGQGDRFFSLPGFKFDYPGDFDAADCPPIHAAASAVTGIIRP